MPIRPANPRRARWAALVSVVSLVGCGAPAVGNASPATSGKAGALPADVRTFKARRDDCDHYRGEASPDPGRARYLDRKLEQTCTGTDAALAALRQLYARNAVVTAALNDYEDTIE